MTDIRRISPNTQFCMVIGDPVAPQPFAGPFTMPPMPNLAWILCMQPAGLKMSGVPWQVCVPWKNFRGMSVTIPHKVAVMAYIDEIAPVDRAIGAINTVIHEPDALIGINTDGPGAIRALAEAGHRHGGP